MAILRDGKRGQIGPSFKGQFYTYEKDGQWVMARWPSKRPGKPTPDLQASRDLFKDACKAMKLHHSAFQVHSRVTVKGTPFLPRDGLSAAFYGKGPTIYTLDGKRRIPLASRLDMSMLLDNLAFERGQMLYRNENTWVPVPVGVEGQVLTFSSELQGPEWRAGGSGGGGPVNTAVHGAPTGIFWGIETFGYIINDSYPFSVHRVGFQLQDAITASFRCSVWTRTGLTLNTLIAEAFIDAGSYPAEHMLYASFDEPVDIPDNGDRLIVIEAIDGGSPVAFNPKRTSGTGLIRPWFGDVETCRSSSPAVPGTTFSWYGAVSCFTVVDWSM